MRSPEQSDVPVDEISLEREASIEAGRLFNEFLENEYGVKEALALLDRLDPKYVYHNKEHTLDVIYETILFAVAEGASMDTIRQEAISAAWHDTGFIPGRPEGMTTEQYAMHLFKESVTYEMLVNEGKTEIALCVLANIEDTEVRKEAEGSPSFKKTHEDTPGFILDGDMSNLGRGDFFWKLELVATELGRDTLDPDVRKEFYTYVLSLMRNHSWKTKSAHTLREEKKQDNMRILTEMLDQL